MDFNTALLLDHGPALLKLFLHFIPHFERFKLKFLDLQFCRLFKLVKTILALYKCGHLHQMFQLRERAVSFVTTPNRLNFYCSQDRPVRSFEHYFWVAHGIQNRLQVDDTWKQVIWSIFIHFKVSKLQHPRHVEVTELDLVLWNQPFNLLHQVSEPAPPCNILTFETHELWSWLIDLTLAD